MKLLSRIIPILLALFLISCATNKDYHVENGRTHFRVPAQAHTLIDGIKEVPDQAGKLVRFLNDNAKQFFGDANIKLNSIDDLRKYDNAYSNVARMLDLNDGKLLWKNKSIIDLGSKWKTLQESNFVRHSAIAKTSTSASNSSALAGAKLKPFVGSKSWTVSGAGDVNKMLNKAFKDGILTESEATAKGNLYRNLASTKPDNHLGYSSALEIELASLYLTGNKKLAPFDAMGSCKTFQEDYDEVLKLNKWGRKILDDWEANPSLMPDDRNTVLVSFAKNGDPIINPGSKNISEMAQNSDEYLKKLDEYGWRVDGGCSSDCKFIGKQACNLAKLK